MILSIEQREEFEKVVRPLIEWLNKECHPHVIAIIEPGRATLTEGMYSVPIEDYIPD